MPAYLELEGEETGLEEVGVVGVGVVLVTVATEVETELEVGGTDPELETVAETLELGAPLELGF